jgi:hypothetical protein
MLALCCSGLLVLSVVHMSHAMGVVDVVGSRSRSKDWMGENNASVTLASNAVNAPVFVKYRQGSFVEPLQMSS